MPTDLAAHTPTPQVTVENRDDPEVNRVRTGFFDHDDAILFIAPAKPDSGWYVSVRIGLGTVSE